MCLNQSYLDSRASISYDYHDELQMRIIVDKIKAELIKRYGDSIDLIKDDVLRRLVK